jgi:uncharacterized protein (TIGR03032 family)
VTHAEAATTAAVAAATPQLEISCSRQLPEWLAEHELSLAFTTYQSAKLFLIGLKPDGRLSVHERTFNRCMGLWSSAQTLWMSSLYQPWRFENVLAPGENHQGYDRLYVPQVGYTTGDLDVHDVAIDAAGRPLFVATLFGCLATISETHSLTPRWRSGRRGRDQSDRLPRPLHATFAAAPRRHPLCAELGNWAYWAR